MNIVVVVFVDKELKLVFVLLYLMLKVLFLGLMLLKNSNDDIWDKTMESIREVLQQYQHIPFK
jgi:hypothetical protein